MEDELISIICTVKNGSGTISDSIDSVINQTYVNWEMIIVDDGSTDYTPSILQNYAELDQRIKPYISDGIGRSHALNKAISLSNGKYICNLDSDDLFHPLKLEKQFEVLYNNPGVFLISTGSIIVYDNNSVYWDELNVNSNNVISKIGKNILTQNPINHSSVIMNKDILNSLGNYDVTRGTQVDYELWLRAFSSGEKMLKMNNILTAKRIHSYQSFENKNRINYLKNAFLLQCRYINKNKKFYLLFLPCLNFIKGLLPFRVRRYIKKFTYIKGR